ncbi:hypothetical protein [Mariniblastus fucicola]|uniref:Uncharacterized protein n=1 Tax=Mariniblastus fucicola TaxID=980251 RepID=A0A5B9PFU0_9BACT|nr:hypothetical protein [Mariniblastus fucicola]QEG24080.1 hypothetical protein MFFC18_39960 [Mariniblastus fucicola]
MRSAFAFFVFCLFTFTEVRGQDVTLDNAEKPAKPLLVTDELASILSFGHLNAGLVKCYDGILLRVDTADTTTHGANSISGLMGQRKEVYRFIFDFERNLFAGVRLTKISGTDFRTVEDGEEVHRRRLSAFLIGEDQIAHLYRNGAKKSLNVEGLSIPQLVTKLGRIDMADFRRYSVNDGSTFAEVLDLRAGAEDIERHAENIERSIWLNAKDVKFWTFPRKYQNGIEIRQFATYDTNLVMPIRSYSMVRSPGREWKVAVSPNRKMGWEQKSDVVVPMTGTQSSRDTFNLTGKPHDYVVCMVDRVDKFHWYSVNDRKSFDKNFFSKDLLGSREQLLKLLDEAVFEKQSGTAPSAAGSKE